VNHIVADYWLSATDHARWQASPKVAGWWNDPKRLSEPCGYFQECLRIPVERQETLYWQGYPAGLSRSDEVAIYPTPYCGYCGVMRDRIPLAASDPLDTPLGAQVSDPLQRDGGCAVAGPYPHNLAVIRSAPY